MNRWLDINRDRQRDQFLELSLSIIFHTVTQTVVFQGIKYVNDCGNPSTIQVDRQTDEQIYRWIDIQMDRCLDGYIDRYIDRYLNKYIYTRDQRLDLY